MHACPLLHLVVLAALLQKKVVSHNDSLTKWDAENKLLHLILDQCTMPLQVVSATANVLDTFECKKEATMLRRKLGLC